MTAASSSALELQVAVAGCPDRTFLAWTSGCLVWLPEHGMGYLPVDELPYDEEYFEKYVGYGATEMGREITRNRVAFVRRHIGKMDRLVDVGIGCGDFLEAARGAGIDAAGFDISRPSVAWLNERGLYRDPMRVPAEALSFWDSLEHIPAAAGVLARARTWAFVSLPIVPGDGPPPLDWKHLRRDEHCWYWTASGFAGWMLEQGFELVEASDLEVRAGRVDIGTFAFRRV